MYCVVINAFRQTLTNGVAVPVSANYYTPQENCLASAGGKNLCGICGEKSKWKKQNAMKTHSTKCCPYRYHFQICNRKEFVDALEEGLDNQKNDFENTLCCAEAKLDSQELILTELKGDLREGISNYKKECEKTELFKNLFSQDEIDKRLVAKDLADKELAVALKECRQIKLEVVEVSNVINKDKVLWEISRGKVKELRNELKNEKIKNVKRNQREIELVNQSLALEEENEKLWDCVSNKKGDKEKCPICQEYIIDNGCKTECGHHYHTKCYSQYICNKMNELSYGKVECCICRATIFEKAY